MEQNAIPLSPEERAPLDEISAQLMQLAAQRTGIILYIARLKGLKNSRLDYAKGMLIVTPVGTPDGGTQ